MAWSMRERENYLLLSDADWPFCDLASRRGATGMNWQAVTFYTTGTGYEREVMRLKASCEASNVPLKIYPFPNMGSWRENLNFKSQVIIDAMADYEGLDIVFIDADAIVRSYPKLFDVLSEKRDHDIGVHFLADRELLSGTIWMANNEMGLRIATRWHALAQANPKQRHQVCLMLALRELMATEDKPRVVKFPIEYTCIFDHPLRRGKVAIIEHFQASRRYRRRIGMQVAQ
jgi:hypothetical protein